MKIVVVISGMYQGGAERVVSILTKEWVLGHDLALVLFDGKEGAYDVLGRVIDLRAGGGGCLVTRSLRVGVRASRLARLFWRERPDRIISFMESANMPAIIAAMMTGMLGRLCVSVRNNPTSIRLSWRLILPIFYRLPARVVAPSKGVMQGLARLGLPRRKLAVIHNPVDLHQLEECRDLGGGEGRMIIGVGRLHAQKGFDRLIRSFAAVAVKGLRLVILGEGNERENLLALADQLGVSGCVSLPGAVTDVVWWYKRATCLVLSSRYEGWPNVLMEALAAGCPAVSFDCRYGPREILEHGKAGVLVRQHDIEALTAGITRVVSEPEYRRSLVAIGRRRASEFTVQAIAPQWLVSGT